MKLAREEEAGMPLAEERRRGRRRKGGGGRMR
jgi:hypothetical protein